MNQVYFSNKIETIFIINHYTIQKKKIIIRYGIYRQKQSNLLLRFVIVKALRNVIS